METNIIALDIDANFNLFHVQLAQDEDIVFVRWERSSKWIKHFQATKQEAFDLIDEFMIIDSFV